MHPSTVAAAAHLSRTQTNNNAVAHFWFFLLRRHLHVGWLAAASRPVAVQTRVSATGAHLNLTSLLRGWCPLFAILAFSLVMFGPLERGMSVNIFSTSFLVLAAGVAGFSQIRAKSFGHSLEAANAHAGAGEKTT